jgi:hypothetical protein
MEVLMTQTEPEEFPIIKEEEKVLILMEKVMLIQVLVCDSDAKCHITNTEEGL